MLSKVKLIILISFFISVTAAFSQNTNYENYTGINIVKPFDSIRYGIMKNGERLVFHPYSGENVTYSNIISYIKPQTPLIIKGESYDKRFFLVEAESLEGFIKRENIFFLDYNLFEEITLAKKGLLKKQVFFDELTLPIATKLPVIKQRKNRFKVKIIKEMPKEIWLSSKELTLPQRLSKTNLINTAKIFRKKTYQWGSLEDSWDCSGLIQDYFAFFGISLPRNSYQQINAVKSIDVSGKTVKEKERILSKAQPYMTLLYFPGHIMLYTGKKGREFMSFQALNRVGDKRYGYIDFFPLKKTRLISKITKIAFLPKSLQSLTLKTSQAKIDNSSKN